MVWPCDLCFDNRYLFGANFRADASSRFPKDNRWGYFPAVSAAWRISQESFMEGTSDWLNNLKLRLGWGRTGNEGAGRRLLPAVATYAYSNNLIGTNLYSSLFEPLCKQQSQMGQRDQLGARPEASFLNNMFCV